VQDALPIVIVAVVVAAGLVGLAAVLFSRAPYERIGRSDLSFDRVDSRVNEDSTREEEIEQMRAALRARRTGSLPAMPALRRFDVDELLTRPGTYFNPETEIVLIVDDSAHVDLELIEDEADDEAAEWILLSDDPAVDEHKRDELVEVFETRRARSSAPEDPDDDEDVEEEDTLEPDPEDDY
jgi:hypothetical protein